MMLVVELNMYHDGKKYEVIGYPIKLDSRFMEIMRREILFKAGIDKP